MSVVTLVLVFHTSRVDLAYYYSGFGPIDQQLLTLLVWVPLQLAAFLAYPAFKVHKLGMVSLVVHLPSLPPSSPAVAVATHMDGSLC